MYCNSIRRNAVSARVKVSVSTIGKMGKGWCFSNGKIDGDGVSTTGKWMEMVFQQQESKEKCCCK